MSIEERGFFLLHGACDNRPVFICELIRRGKGKS